MKTPAVIDQIFSWLKTTELFLNPEKLLPGKWSLYEYYTEPGEELFHFQENQLIAEQLSWRIVISPDHQFISKTNLPVPLIAGDKEGNWEKSGIYLSLCQREDAGDKIKFQYAVGKEDLKLLKKDAQGKIVVFGFFRKAE